MNLVDVNVLIYAINADSPHHRKARRWLEAALSGVELIALTWPVLLAFLRLTTRPGIMEKPLEPEAAIAFVDAWTAQPNVEIAVPGESHWAVLKTLVAAAGTAGNLTTDAHLAAMALEGGWTLVSTDHDFRRFPALAVLNPLDV